MYIHGCIHGHELDMIFSSVPADPSRLALVLMCGSQVPTLAFASILLASFGGKHGSLEPMHA